MTIKRGNVQSNKRKTRKAGTEIFPLCMENNAATGVCSVTITPYTITDEKQNCTDLTLTTVREHVKIQILF